MSLVPRDETKNNNVVEVMQVEKTMVLKIFSSRFKEALRGHKKGEIANKIGIAPSSISMYSRGQALPSLEVFQALCASMGLNADWLLGLSDERSGGRVVTGSGGAIVVGGDANSSFNSPAPAAPPALDELRAQVSDLRAQLAARDATIASLAATLRAISSSRPASIVAAPSTPK